MECNYCRKVQLRVLTTSGKGQLSPRFVDKVKGLFGVYSYESNNFQQNTNRSNNSNGHLCKKGDLYNCQILKDDLGNNSNSNSPLFSKSEESLRRKVLDADYNNGTAYDNESLKYSNEHNNI